VVNRTVQQKIRRKAYIETVEIKPDANKVIFKIKCNTPEDSLDFGVLLPEESEKDKKDRKIKKVKAYKYEVSF
jgi:ribosomal protein L31E